MRKGTDKMPRQKSVSTMTSAERDKAFDDLISRFNRVERIVHSGSLTKPAAKASAKKTAAPKKKAVAASKKVSPPKKANKPGPKPKVKAKAATKTGTSKKPPRLIDSIQTVMGTSTMTAIQVHAELKKRHWLPNSDDPLGYIRYTLSKEKDIFLRIEGQRGHYHLGKGKAKPQAKAAAKAPPAPKSAPAVVPPAAESKPVVAAPAPAPAVSKPAGEDEDPATVANDILKDAGIDMGASPLPGQ